MKDRRAWTAVAMTALMLLAGPAGPAAGAEWVYFATTAKGTHYYDRQSVKRTNATTSVHEKTVYGEEGRRAAEKFLAGTGEYRGQSLHHVVTVSEFNCRAAKARSLSMTIYDAEGRRVAGSPAGGSPWRDLVPGTLHDKLSRQVCP
ncbi:MAG: hypothetical protein HPY67_08855 [Syntrophaceae bacterium]|nr:hypothetical protein [Syntrophaceae bacterium]